MHRRGSDCVTVCKIMVVREREREKERTKRDGECSLKRGERATEEERRVRDG